MNKLLIALGIFLACVGIGFIAYSVFYFNYSPPSLKSEKDVSVNQKEEPKTKAKSPALPAAEKVTTFAFAGDMMFDRYVNHAFKVDFNAIFKNWDKTVFTGKDIAFANLEGPVSDKPIVDDYPERTLVFNMPPETIPTIKNIGVNGVSLANNHTLNNSNEGFSTTKKLLSDTNLKFGGSQNAFDTESVIKYDTAIPVSIVVVDYLSYKNLTKITETIKAEKKSGRYVIVFPHWGEEYSLTHSAEQRTAAEEFINAGASLILGSHPHVAQDIEIINNVPVIYSLGNFVFDQTFSKETQQGLVVQGKITNSSLELDILPIESKKLMPELLKSNDKEEMLKRILSSIQDNTKLNSSTIKINR